MLKSGQLLWQRDAYVIEPGSPPTGGATVVLDTGFEIQQVLKTQPNLYRDLQIIPITLANPLTEWLTISVDIGVEPLSGKPAILFSNTDEVSHKVDALLWLPHSAVGPGVSDSYVGTGDTNLLGEPPIPNGQLLWHRRRVRLQPGLSQVASGLHQRFLDIDPSVKVSINVILLPALAAWVNLAHGPADDNGIFPFFLNGQTPIDVNILFWLPHTLMGPGRAVPYQQLL